jgi:hypothetical protein
MKCGICEPADADSFLKSLFLSESCYKKCIFAALNINFQKKSVH